MGRVRDIDWGNQIKANSLSSVVNQNSALSINRTISPIYSDMGALTQKFNTKGVMGKNYSILDRPHFAHYLDAPQWLDHQVIYRFPKI